MKIDGTEALHFVTAAEGALALATPAQYDKACELADALRNLCASQDDGVVGFIAYYLNIASLGGVFREEFIQKARKQ
jgi:hypothetical protein